MGPDGSLTWEEQDPCCVCLPKAERVSDTVRVDVAKLSMELAKTGVSARLWDTVSPWEDQGNPLADPEEPEDSPMPNQCCPCPHSSVLLDEEPASWPGTDQRQHILAQERGEAPTPSRSQSAAVGRRSPERNRQDPELASSAGREQKQRDADVTAADLPRVGRVDHRPSANCRETSQAGSWSSSQGCSRSSSRGGSREGSRSSSLRRLQDLAAREFGDRVALERWLTDGGFPSGQVNAKRVPETPWSREGLTKWKRTKVDTVYPLHAAVAEGNSRIVELLLRYGADTTLTDSAGKTPLALAEGMAQQGAPMDYDPAHARSLLAGLAAVLKELRAADAAAKQ